MPTKEYQEAVSELLDILGNTDEKLVKKIPPELIVFWEQNKSDEYIPELDHNVSLEEMDLKAKTRQLIAMIYVNYLCDPEKKKEIRKILKESEEKEQNKEAINIFAEESKKEETEHKSQEEEIKQKRIEEQEDFEKIKEDIYMIEKEKPSPFLYIIEQIKKFIRKIIY